MGDSKNAYLFGELFRQLARDDFSKQEFANKLWKLKKDLDFCDEDMEANEALKKFGLARQTEEKEDDDYIWEYGPGTDLPLIYKDEVRKEALLKCEEFYIKLHKLIKEGQGDGPAADLIRHELNYPYSFLDKYDQELINNISGDLFLLNKNEIRFIRKPSNRDIFDNPWKNLLLTFRSFKELRLADFKVIGTCYTTLGFHKVAQCFFDFVEDPSNAYYVSIGLPKVGWE